MFSILPEYPLLFWFTAAAALTILGIGKSGFGGGFGIVAIPLMAISISPVEAAALLLPLLLIMDVFSMRYYYRTYDSRTLRILLPAVAIGVALGGLFFQQFSQDEDLLRFGIGVIGLLFVLIQMSRGLILGRLDAYRLPDIVGRIIGVIAGFTSTLVHAGGPPANIYILPQKLPRQIFVGTTVLLWFTANLMKLIPYGLLGLLQIGNLITIALLSPFCFLGVRLGWFLNGRVNEQAFQWVVYTLLLFTSLQLVIGQNLLLWLVG